MMNEPPASAHFASCWELDLPCSFVPSFHSQQTTDWQRGMDGGPALPSTVLAFTRLSKRRSYSMFI
jgi:hypothetical protein